MAGTSGNNVASLPDYENRKRLAWLLLALSFTFVGLLIAAMLFTGCRYLFDPSDPRPATAYGMFTIPANALAFSLMGALVIGRRPENRYGWLMLLFGLGLNMMVLLSSYSTCSLSYQTALPYGVETLWIDSFVSTFVFFAGFFLLLALYPDGRFLSPRWRGLGLLLLGINFVLVLLSAFTPGPIGESNLRVTAENPFGLELMANPALTALLNGASGVLFLAILATGIASLLQRYRRARGETRLQIKWFLFFAATAGVIFVIVEIIGETIYPPIFDGWFYAIELAFFWIGFPLVIGLAVLRYRLFDIDIIIRRTLLYGMQTAVLVAIYFGVVLLAQSAFVALTGEESPIAIVISTLVIAALFNPLRKRLQAFIDRRFYRQSYDAALTLKAFGQTSRDEVDMEQLTAELARVVRETMQPEAISLWMKSPVSIFPANSPVQGRVE